MRQKHRRELDMKAEIDPATGKVRAVTRRHRRRRSLPERARRPRCSCGASAPSTESKTPRDAADCAGALRGGFPAGALRSVLDAGRARARRSLDGKGVSKSAQRRRGVRARQQPLSARVSLALAPDTASLARAARATGGERGRPRSRRLFDAAGRQYSLPRGSVASVSRARRSSSTSSTSSCGVCGFFDRKVTARAPIAKSARS
jgi:hypothetical protein